MERDLCPLVDLTKRKVFSEETEIDFFNSNLKYI